jgi:adenylate cyclase class 2
MPLRSKFDRWQVDGSIKVTSQLVNRSTYFAVMHINFEFKARHNDVAAAERILLQEHPLFVGEDHQADTYFNVPHGRLKLREGTIEHALIFYERTDAAAAKQSDVTLYQHKPDEALKQILAQSLGIKTVVNKRRKIYFINNVKFHFDTVEGLGQFVEVEAIDKDGSLGLNKLKEQCRHYQNLLKIAPADFIAGSYSDMLLAKKSSSA